MIETWSRWLLIIWCFCYYYIIVWIKLKHQYLYTIFGVIIYQMYLWGIHFSQLWPNILINYIYQYCVTFCAFFIILQICKNWVNVYFFLNLQQSLFGNLKNTCSFEQMQPNYQYNVPGIYHNNIYIYYLSMLH